MRLHIGTRFVDLEFIFTLLIYLHLQKNAIRPRGSYGNRVEKVHEIEAQPDEKTERKLRAEIEHQS